MITLVWHTCTLNSYTKHVLSLSLSLSLSPPLSTNAYSCTYTVFLVEEVLLDEVDERLSPIEGEDAQISIPREVLEGLERGELVRMASFLFRNMSGLLPETLEGGNNNRLFDNECLVPNMDLSHPLMGSTLLRSVSLLLTDTTSIHIYKISCKQLYMTIDVRQPQLILFQPGIQALGRGVITTRVICVWIHYGKYCLR